MLSREAPEADVALLSASQRRAYEVVIAELQKNGAGRGIMQALKDEGIRYSDWSNAQTRLTVMKDKRNRAARLDALIKDEPHPDGIRPGDPITLTPERKKEIRAVREEMKTERRGERLLRRANIDAVSPTSAPSPPATLVVSPVEQSTIELSILPAAGTSNMPSPIREDCALSNVLAALRRIPLEERKKVLEAARWMSGCGD